jgi:oxygen-dependent protoporphyrinogen oxidase
MTARVVVIGGGFAGIAAAVALRNGGASVTLLETRRVLGGRARSDELAGLTIDTGAQLMATSFTRTLRLLAPHGVRSAVGGADAPLRVVPGRDAFVRDGERLPLQFGSIRSLLAFGGLSAMEKLKLGTHLVPLLATHRAALDAAAERIPGSLDAESARAYMRDRLGEHTADVLVEPPLNGFYATRGNEASLAFYLMLGHYGSEGDVLAPTAGWSRALDQAASGVTCELEVRVSALELDGRGVVVRAEDGRAWRADGAVIATGPRAAQTLLAPHMPADDALLRWLAGVELRPTWTLALALDVAPRRDAFGLFHGGNDSRVVSACAVHGAKMAVPPPDRDVVLAWPTPEAVRTLAGSSSERIASAMLPEIEALIPEVRGHVTRARVYRFDEGTPIARPGFATERARGRALAAALTLPVALAGDYLAAPLIEGAVASGERAATLLAGRLRSHGAPLDS